MRIEELDNVKEPFQQPFSFHIWKDNYKTKEENYCFHTFRRVAKFVAKNDTQYELPFYNILKDFSFISGGRITANAGYENSSLLNCFVSGFQGRDRDSLSSIYDELKRQALILKSQGGYGINFDTLRPKNCLVKGSGLGSPGIVKMMELWDTSSEVSMSGEALKIGDKKPRRGAQLSTLSIWHPEIEEYIQAKNMQNKLTKFNMTVLINDQFMDAVRKHKPWMLIFPYTTYEKYESDWDGNIQKWKSKNYPVKVYKYYKNANELWELLLKNAYDRNEPAIMFVDRVNKFNNLNYCEYINAANACGEQPMPINSSCVLGHLNLTQFINKNHTDFDYEKLNKVIPVAVRFLDNVHDVTHFPLPEQKKESVEKRRIGLGYTGYASALYFLRLKYGSLKALKITENLCSFVANRAYMSSAMIAKEKGSYNIFEYDKFEKSVFVNNVLSEDTKKTIRLNGLRNSHILTCAPTGTGAIFANNISSGIEPIISHKMIRTVVQHEKIDEISIPKNIDWKNQSDISGWEWEMEGDEHILVHKIYYGNKTRKFKIDKNRGFCKEEEVVDYAVFNTSDFNPNADYAKTIYDLCVDDHIQTLNIFSKYVCSNISKTINIPQDTSFENFKDIFMKAYLSDYIKSLSTYKMGTMTEVIRGSKEKYLAIKRPKSISCNVHKIKVQGVDWIVFVGILNNQPFEVFAGRLGNFNLPKNIIKGNITKENSLYNFVVNDKIIIENISKTFDNNEHSGATRLISLALRHRVPIKFIIQQLNRSRGNVVDFSKSIIVALKEYVKNNEKIGKCKECRGQLIFIDGCTICNSCGVSKC